VPARHPASWVDHRAPAMGGSVLLRAAFSTELADDDRASVAALLARAEHRLQRWAARLTRHHPSELTRLNADPRGRVPVGATMAAVLAWGADAAARTGGLVAVDRLEARLAAEQQVEPAAPDSAGWRLDLRTRAHRIVGGELTRPAGRAFDLDGVGKGWIADRAARLLSAALAGRADLHSVVVEADGDIAIIARPDAETTCRVELPGRAIGAVVVCGSRGVATSGTGVFSWGDRHHLIDPRSNRPSSSGIVQATVVAASAREAEAWAKAVVVAGADGMARAEAAGVERVVAVDAAGRVLSLPALPLPRGPRFIPDAEAVQ